MPYELLTPTPEESHLFSRQSGESSEQYGAIGLLKMSFGMHGRYPKDVWLDCQKRLCTSAFKNEIDSLVHFLRDGGIFRDLSDEHLWRRSAQGLLDRNGWGVKVVAADFSFYIRCLPHVTGTDTLIFAYDNRYLLPGLTERPNPRQPTQIEKGRER